jgi:hypothetical protein
VQTQFYGPSHRIEQKLTQERGPGAFLFQITTSGTSWPLHQLNSPSTTVISVFLPSGRFVKRALKVTILAPSFKQAGRAQIPPKISTSQGDGDRPGGCWRGRRSRFRQHRCRRRCRPPCGSPPWRRSRRTLGPTPPSPPSCEVFISPFFRETVRSNG